MNKFVKYGMIFSTIFALVALGLYVKSLFTDETSDKEIYQTIAMGFSITAGVLIVVCFVIWGYVELTEDKNEIALNKELSNLRKKIVENEQNLQKSLDYLNVLFQEGHGDKTSINDTLIVRAIDDANKFEKRQQKIMKEMYGILQKLDSLKIIQNFNRQ